MTWGWWLYFPSEGRRAEDFFTLKNPTASAGFEPVNLGTKGQHATSRPPKPLSGRTLTCYSSTCLEVLRKTTKNSTALFSLGPPKHKVGVLTTQMYLYPWLVTTQKKVHTQKEECKLLRNYKNWFLNMDMPGSVMKISSILNAIFLTISHKMKHLVI